MSAAHTPGPWEVQEFGAHTAEHHTGTRHGYDTKRSMEAFALLREELKAERAIKAELLEALEALIDGADAMGWSTAKGYAAIAKAKGQA